MANSETKPSMKDTYCNPFSMKKILDDLNKTCDGNENVPEERAEFLKRPVHEKITALTKIRSYTTTVASLKEMTKKEAQKAIEIARNKTPGYVEPEFILELTKDIHRLGEKSAKEYVSINKTILLSEHSLKIKQQDMLRMKNLADDFEAQLAEDEEKLEKDAYNFNEFIKNMNTLSAVAVKRLIEEMKVKCKKVEQVRILNAQIFLLKSQIAKLEQSLSEYLICASFLEAAKPRTGKDEESKIKLLFQNESMSFDPSILLNESQEPIEIAFKDENELLKAINRFRDQNLNIITNSHYIRKSLTDTQATYHSLEEKMQKDLDMYLKQIEDLRKDIKSYQEKTKKFEEWSSVASLKGSEEEKQCEKALAPKITATYELCTGIKGGKISLTMMITAIESYLSDLLSEIRNLPEKAIMKVYKLKQMERKTKKRKEDEERRAKIQEERIKKTDMRRFDPAKMKLKRRLMYQPQAMKLVHKKKEVKDEVSKDEKEDRDFFFS